MPTARLTQSGAVELPADLRQRLGLLEGDEVVLESARGEPGTMPLYTRLKRDTMPITLQNPALDSRLRSLAAETGTSPEALAEETLTRYFAATAELGTMLTERLREVEDGRVEAVDGETAFAQLRKRSQSAR